MAITLDEFIAKFPEFDNDEYLLGDQDRGIEGILDIVRWPNTNPAGYTDPSEPLLLRLPGETEEAYEARVEAAHEQYLLDVDRSRSSFMRDQFIDEAIYIAELRWPMASDEAKQYLAAHVLTLQSERQTTPDGGSSEVTEESEGERKVKYVEHEATLSFYQRTYYGRMFLHLHPDAIRILVMDVKNDARVRCWSIRVYG